MKRYFVIFILSFTIVGCYTRVAVKEDESEYAYYGESEEYIGEEEYSDENVTYDTVYYDESEPKYKGFEDKEVNNYYINMDSYSISPWLKLSISSGYYDPYFAWDYYWYTHSWCSPRVYFDGFYFGYYWRPYYYEYWYDWGPYYGYNNYYYNYGNYYNGGYSGNVTHPGKTRDNDGGRKTRNDGRTVTSSFGNTSRDNTFTGREVLKDRERVTRTDDKIRKLNEERGIPTDRLRGNKREVLIDKESNNITNRKVIIKDDNGNTIIRDKEQRIQDDKEKRVFDRNNNNTGENVVRKKIYIKQDPENRRTVERKTDRNDGNRDYEPRVNKDRNNDNGNNDRNRNYEPPVKQNRDNTPKREYRNQEPPRNYNPPVNNNSGNNSRGDNGGSRNSGTRERR